MHKDVVDYDATTGTWIAPLIRRTYGYCVHKTKQKKTGTLTKIELFAFFNYELLSLIQEKVEDLDEAKPGTYPPYFDSKGKYHTEFQRIVLWNGAPIGIRCYTQKRNGPFKLEVVRGRMKGRGRKFLAPISTLNSLGSLIRFLTNNSEPIHGRSHDDFQFIDEFLNECASSFKKQGLNGQIRLMTEQKLREDLWFAFSGKGL